MWRQQVDMPMKKKRVGREVSDLVGMNDWFWRVFVLEVVYGVTVFVARMSSQVEVSPVIS